MTPLFSILICHLNTPERNESLKKLLCDLAKQTVPEIEILVETDNGELTVGRKRNLLVEKSTGEYCAFIDDDDTVASDYVRLIVNAIIRGNHPDCVGIEGLLSCEEPYLRAMFKHSISYAGWYTGADAFYRTPNHLNPIRRTILLKTPFPELNRGEDQDFSKRIRQYLKSERYIDGPIYFYNYAYKEGDDAL